VTALGIAFAEKSHLVAVGWGVTAAASAALAFVLVPQFGANGAAWSVVLVYAGLTLFYAGCTQRLHPLPFRIGPVALQLTLGVATVIFAWVMQRQPLSVATGGLKLLWWITGAGLLFVWGGVQPRRLVALLASLRGFGPRAS
jgi:O-antigen/teichoic acid export membrane protein